MNEAVLVMDMPKSCSRCRLISHTYNNIETQVHCPFGTLAFEPKDLPYISKPHWCPLMPEPERMTEREVIEIENAVTYTYKNIYAKGWNACLDALEGKENE